MTEFSVRIILQKGLPCMTRLLYTLIQCTWGLPQTLIGLVLFLYYRRRGCLHYQHHCGICTHWDRGGGISLGLFFFCSGEHLRAHEWGHTVQSLILGPLYLIVVGLPSMVWCGLPYFKEYRKRNGVPYSALYCEKWADAIGEKLDK